MSFKYEIPG